MQYLSALNNEVLTLDENTFYKLAKDSVIKERIKKNELVKYYDIPDYRNVLMIFLKIFTRKWGMKMKMHFKIT